MINKDYEKKSVPRLLLISTIVLSFLALYTRTTAPSVLSGDSAEFQLVAVTLGVAHPTTYPLYTLLGALMARLLPVGDAAWRVTMLSALCAALALGVFSALLVSLKHAYRAILLSSMLLGVAPGLWNAATLAEVYTLLILLMLVQALTILHKHLALAAFVAGLGFTHHGLFVISILPIFTLWLLDQLSMIYHTSKRKLLTEVLGAIFGFLLGLTPWLYPIIQFTRYGPFNGWDYGLPQHYFWGAPTHWLQLFDLLSGGTIRRGIFRIPAISDISAVLGMLRERAFFEFGWLGLSLGIIGCVMLFHSHRRLWLASAWILFSTIAYLLLLGPAVADAPTFTIPMLLPWALFIAYAVDWIIRRGQGSGVRGQGSDYQTQGRRDKTEDTQGSMGAVSMMPYHESGGLLQAHLTRQKLSWAMFSILCILSIWWGTTRIPYANKRHLWLFREFGEAALSQMAPDAVVLAHWEQGMTLQYLHLVEGQRPDVWVDVVEPGDEAWEARIQRRYQSRPVYLIGSNQDVEGLSVEGVYQDEYARMFRYMGVR